MCAISVQSWARSVRPTRNAAVLFLWHNTVACPGPTPFNLEEGQNIINYYRRYNIEVRTCKVRPAHGKWEAGVECHAR